MTVPVYLPPARTVASNRMVTDQVDFFNSGARVAGILTSGLVLEVYLNGSVVAWTLASGAGVPDVRVAAGKVYWTEFSAGYYSVRLFPNSVGLWRIILTDTARSQAVSFTYDVVSQASSVGTVGIRTSFTKG